MGDPVSEGAYYVMSGREFDTGVFLVQDGRVEAARLFTRGARARTVLAGLGEAVASLVGNLTRQAA
jgi:hypothetical protein